MFMPFCNLLWYCFTIDKITQKPPKWEARRERQLVSTPSPTTSDLADLDLSDSEDDCDLITDFSLSTKNVPSKSQGDLSQLLFF